MGVLSSKEKYESEVKLGEKYRDTQTGIEGTAVSIAFHQFGCERVGLETVIAGKIEEYWFDTPRVVNVKTEVRATTTKKGGPRDAPPRTGLR